MESNSKQITIFTVTDSQTNELFEEAIEGEVNESINFLRKEYPKFSKITIKGFEINEEFFPINLETDNIARR